MVLPQTAPSLLEVNHREERVPEAMEPKPLHRRELSYGDPINSARFIETSAKTHVACTLALYLL